MDELNFKTVTELARLLRARKLSSVEITTHFLKRLEKFGPRYNALAELTRPLALAQARRADQRLRAGDIPSPLLGIPYGAKDLLATKNIPTRWGAPPYRDQVFNYDAAVIQKLRDAGAVLIGKLAMVELAGGGGYEFASASLHGPGLNPWNLNHWSGGSSSGSGSAVAGGLVPFALGSETWGSIVSPSTYCGITGLRPTWGLVSRFGAMELAPTMDKIGPMAHSAEDCGWALQAISGQDARDDATFGMPTFRFRPHIPNRVFRLGVLPADFSDAPDVARAFDAALATFRGAGIKIARVAMPDYPFAEIARVILGAEAATAHAKLIASDQLDELVDASQRQGLKHDFEITAVAYLQALRDRDRLAVEIRKIASRFDALVSPSVIGEAITLDTSLLTLVRKRGSYTVLGALFGLPNLALPMGLGSHNLPLGLSLTGKPFDENTLLHLGMLFQRETQWHQMRPPADPD